MMDVFVARQPIFDVNNNVVAYELLFRESEENIYNCGDKDRATYEVISNSFSIIGIEKITKGKKAFINFTSDNIKSGLTYILSSNDIVIEILETVDPDEEILKACIELKKQGYTLALDDFVFNSKYEKLLELVDIIKVDFMITKGEERRGIIERIERLSSNKIKFLAEKVETREEYEQAMEYGYCYFQGYFFSKPVIISGQSIPSSKITYLNIIKELNSQKLDIDKLEEIIKKEVSISYKFLKLINSSAYYFRRQISSMRQALILLGESEVTKWLYLIIMGEVGFGESDELIQLSITRAKFAENLLVKMNLKDKSLDAYIMGMFANIDALLNQPIKVALDAIFIKEEIKLAILGENNFYGKLLKLMFAYEKGEWDEVNGFSSELNISDDILVESYIDAIESIKVLQG